MRNGSNHELRAASLLCAATISTEIPTMQKSLRWGQQSPNQSRRAVTAVDRCQVSHPAAHWNDQGLSRDHARHDRLRANETVLFPSGWQSPSPCPDFVTTLLLEAGRSGPRLRLRQNRPPKTVRSQGEYLVGYRPLWFPNVVEKQGL